MKELHYEELIRIYQEDIKESKRLIDFNRKHILDLNNEIKELELDRQKSMTTPKELGFEGNGVNCGD
jgi:hypothetical protein